MIIGIDNSAAAFAVRKLYSTNELVNSYLRSLHRSMTKTKCTVEVLDVRSEQNAADIPSRPRRRWSRAYRMALEKKCFDCLKDAMHGNGGLAKRPTSLSCDELGQRRKTIPESSFKTLQGKGGGGG